MFGNNGTTIEDFKINDDTVNINKLDNCDTLKAQKITCTSAEIDNLDASAITVNGSATSKSNILNIKSNATVDAEEITTNTLTATSATMSVTNATIENCNITNITTSNIILDRTSTMTISNWKMTVDAQGSVSIEAIS